MSIRDLKLLKTKKGRDEAGLFMIEGERFVQEIPLTWHVMQYIIARRYASTHDISQYEMRASCEIVRDSIFDSLADTVSPQGVIAVCKKREFHLEEVLKRPPPHFILLGENLNDPGNIGALVRTAAAAGACGIILTIGSGDIYNSKVLRAAAGAVLRLPIISNMTLQEALIMLAKSDIPTYAAHPRGNMLPYDLDLNKSFCLLVGNESHGISDTAAELASNLVTLPMVNNTESLNASVAGSILMYEAVRQRTQIKI